MTPSTNKCFSYLAIFVASSYLVACATGSPLTKTTAPDQPAKIPQPASVTVTVSPASASLRANSTISFKANVSGITNSSVTWAVNSTPGGSATVGTIDASGNYTAPSSIPSPNIISVTATTVTDKTNSAPSAVTLLNPTPALASISPTSVKAGSFTLNIAGSGFVPGGHVLMGSSYLNTTFVSSTHLTASGSSSSAGSFAITVQNPDPGGSTSLAVSFEVNAAPPPPPPTQPPSSPSSPSSPSQTSSGCSQMSVGQTADLNGFVPFGPNSPWTEDISNAPVDPNSDAIITFMGSGRGLHPDFGSGLYEGASIGIPYTVVDGTQAAVPVTYTEYGSESDPGPMPIPPTSSIVEGYPLVSSGDRHVLVLDKSNCFLYELFSATPGSTDWTAAGGAVWDLLNVEQRPYEWTSADAAGMAIFPGLVRYDEVATGTINHAIRVTVAYSRAAFIPPASHWAPRSNDPMAPPMGMRLRLKASFDVSRFSPTNQIILNAMKKYGLIVADNGTTLFIGGTTDDRWDNADLHNLNGAVTSDFEVIQESPVYTASNVPTGPGPQISSFTASSTSVSSGTPVTLSWNVSGASYVIVSPSVGATRGTSVTVSPTATTTYTLYATNAFGRTTSTVTVDVN